MDRGSRASLYIQKEIEAAKKIRSEQESFGYCIEGNFQNERKNSITMPKDGITTVLFPGYLERLCGRFRVWLS